MPARVHAFVVVRPDGRSAAALHLRRTLAALGEQTRPADALTIVLCGADEALTDIAAASGAEGVIAAPAATAYAAALSLATARLDGDAVWLLAQDTAPEPEALARLAGALELAPSVAFVAPKLVRWDDRSEIVSLGVSMTRFGRSVQFAEGEFDQGQHDALTDVLGSDVRGILIRSDSWESLGGADPALAGADEGLDLGVRVRLAGGRVTVVPRAVVAVAGDGVAGLPAPLGGARARRRAFAGRVAQLHRRLSYASMGAVPLLWLMILPLAVWRTVTHLVAKAPGLVVAEWGAAFVGAVQVNAVARARHGIRRLRTVPWAQLAPLRVSRAQLHTRFADDPDAAGARHDRRDLRFFTGGGAWAVLAALLISVAAFPALLAWPVLGGGALQPLRATIGQLWADAAYGSRAMGLDALGAADPFAGVVALVGSLWPAEPSRVLVVLWALALPLAVLGGWFAATRVTERSSLRITGGIVWALAPTFLAALIDGRPAAVLVHLLLPWLMFTGAVAHRSWAASGAASLLLAAVVACAPSIASALIVIWAGTVVLILAVQAGRGVTRVAWVVVPAALLSAPVAWTQLRAGNLLGLAADPGVTWLGVQVAPDAAGRALLAAGFPTPDPGGWTALLAGVAPGAPTWWVPLLAAPVAILALLAPLTQRWAAGTALLAVSVLGLGTAFAASGIAVATAGDTSVRVWPGTGVSLAWLGALGAALVALDTGLAPRLRLARGTAAAVMVAAMAVLAIPALTATARGVSQLTNGPDSTLPAYVAARGRDDTSVGTLVITPLNDGGVTAAVVWGGSETLGGHSSVQETRRTTTPADDELAELTADAVTLTSQDVVARLAERGIGFVLVAPAASPESDPARAFRLSAATALNQRDGVDAVGDTAKGELWRVTERVTARAADSASVVATARGIATAQLAGVGVALLLAVPTAASRRQARRLPRVVGPYWQEGR